MRPLELTSPTPRKRSGKPTKPGAKPPAAPERPEAEREKRERTEPRVDRSDDDRVDEASIESFPASDPPAFIGATI